MQLTVLSEPDKKTFLPPLPQYSEGPQGDPFAPQLPPAYFPEEAPQTVILQKPVKKKRRAPRESLCSICGEEQKVGAKGSEAMLVCVECGTRGKLATTLGAYSRSTVCVRPSILPPPRKTRGCSTLQQLAVRYLQNLRVLSEKGR